MILQTVNDNSMHRRLFFKRSCEGIILLTCPTLLSGCNNNIRIRFGLVTDLHFSHRETYGTRFFTQSKDKLLNAIKVFNKEKLDFLIELGDFKDQDTVPERNSTLAYLDEIEKDFHSFNGAVYHVLGNHDMDSISKDDFLMHTQNYGEADKKNYYSFIKNNLKFIVLDANYNEDGSDYNSGNFDWTKAYIPDIQKDWLRKELNTDYPAIIFIHQLLDSFSDIKKELCVANAEEIVDILEDSGNVLAVFQGHHHDGQYSFRNKIHYFTMKGLIEGSLPDNNSFAIVEIDKQLNIYLKGFYNCENKEMKISETHLLYNK